MGSAPRTGVWRLGERGDIEFIRVQTHRRTVERGSDAFFLRIAQSGDLVERGDDIGILVARGRMMTSAYALTDRAQAWIAAIRKRFVMRTLPSHA